MPIIRVIDRSGVEREVHAEGGQKLMEVLRELDYGVTALCGGMCSCGTCHVYVDAQWMSRLSAPISNERELLAELTHTKTESRLSCQIDFTDALDGLTVAIAPEE